MISSEEDFFEECDCDECRFGCEYLRGVQGSVGHAASTSDIQGFQGLIGPSAQGTPGSLGPQGMPCSCSGAQGQRGMPGPQGDPVVGPQGLSGQQGTAFRGMDGNQGNQGPIGFIGDVLNGPQGLDGIGSQGPFGIQGEPGMDSNGSQGFQGYQGLQSLYVATYAGFRLLNIWQPGVLNAIFLSNINVSLRSSIVQTVVLTITKGYFDVVASRTVTFDANNYIYYQVVNFDFCVVSEDFSTFYAVNIPARLEIGHINNTYQRIGGPNVSPVH